MQTIDLGMAGIGERGDKFWFLLNAHLFRTMLRLHLMVFSKMVRVKNLNDTLLYMLVEYLRIVMKLFELKYLIGLLENERATS